MQQAPQTTQETLTRLRDMLPSLAKRMRQCGEFVMEHHDKIAFSTVAEMAEMANVQPSAFMRFCQTLGFNGYSDLRKVFREDVIRTAPDYTTRIANLRTKGTFTPTNLLAEFVEAGRDSLELLTHDVVEENLNAAVQKLGSAELIHIIGYRRAFPVANCLSYALEKLGIANICHDNVGRVARFSAIRPTDAVVAITFAPYTAGTVEIAEAARDKGATIVAISDSDISPINMSNVTFLKAVDLDVGDFRSLAASISLVMALAVAVGSYREGKTNN